MEIYKLVLNQMLVMVTLIFTGFFLRKKKVLPDGTDIVLSKLETFIFVPALSLYNQLTYCTVENFKENFKLMLYGLVTVAVAVLLAYPVSKLFVRNAKGDDHKEYERNVFRYALTFGNYGFMGNFIVLGIWGNETLFKYLMYTFFIGIVCSSWGLYILIPKESNSRLLYKIKKGFLTPPMIALVIGMVGGLLGLGKILPQFFMTALSNASSCMGPVAMLLAGIVIANYDIKALLTNKKVYVVTFLRLIVLPSIFVGALKLLNAPDEIVSLSLIAFATPLGMNTIVYPAAYGGDTRVGASMTVISHVLSVITIPIMYLIFVILL